jgi:lactobin A/cerein 7B family class IIb bacteriocin
MNLTPRVDIAELSDAELENVSGGNAGVGASASLVGGLSTGLVEPLTAGACTDLQATLSPEGAAAGSSTGVHTTSL